VLCERIPTFALRNSDLGKRICSMMEFTMSESLSLPSEQQHDHVEITAAGVLISQLACAGAFPPISSSAHPCSSTPQPAHVHSTPL
jgi:hypothetical protein